MGKGRGKGVEVAVGMVPLGAVDCCNLAQGVGAPWGEEGDEGEGCAALVEGCAAWEEVSCGCWGAASSCRRPMSTAAG